MALEPYQQRLVDERDALIAGMTALSIFTGGDKFPLLDRVDRLLLVKQLDAQRELCDVLNQRIARFQT
jgi:hypothetical protein